MAASALMNLLLPLSPISRMIQISLTLPQAIFDFLLLPQRDPKPQFGSTELLPETHSPLNRVTAGHEVSCSHAESNQSYPFHFPACF